jgi:hypothetical protein
MPTIFASELEIDRCPNANGRTPAISQRSFGYCAIVVSRG